MPKVIRRVGKIVWVPVMAFFFLAGPARAGLIDQVPEVDANAEASHDPIFHEDVTKGIEMVFTDRYEESLVLFKKLQRMYPDHPAPHFFMAAAYQSWMNVYRTLRFQREMEDHVQAAIDKGTRLLKHSEDPWLFFYVGAAYGYRALNRFRKHDWIGAYFDARRGVYHFNEALKRDSRLYDVYLGVGSYHYWRTAKSKFLRVIAFWIPDKRELGLRQLDFAIKHGIYARHEASYNLLAALFDSGRYHDAMELIDRTIARKPYPGLSDLYYKGCLMVEFGRWVEVEDLMRKVLRRLNKNDYASTGYKVECKYWIAVALKAQGKVQEAVLMAEDALMQCRSRNAETELEGPFETFEEIRQRLQELHQDLKTHVWTRARQ